MVFVYNKGHDGKQQKQGDTFKTNIGGLIAGEGSAELLYNPSETGAGYTTFIDDVLTTGDNADALFELFPDSSTSAKKISFAGDYHKRRIWRNTWRSSSNKYQFYNKRYHNKRYLIH